MPNTRTLLTTLIVTSALLTACGSPSPQPAGAASQSAAQRLDSQQVPEDLRHLVPLAEKWGIGDDVERLEKVDSASPAEREELRNGVEPVHARITAWLDSFPEGEMTDEAAAFMYMQLALEEMTAGGSNPR